LPEKAYKRSNWRMDASVSDSKGRYGHPSNAGTFRFNHRKANDHKYNRPHSDTKFH